MSKQKNRGNKPAKQQNTNSTVGSANQSMSAESSVETSTKKAKFAKKFMPANTHKKVSATSIMTRRNALKALIALPVVGAAGAAIHRYDVQNRGLHNLTIIGQGKPVVVQIHDPSCPLCRRLMNNSRQALKDQDNVLFRVADVTTGNGGEFQRQHNASTVSLLLFNADGQKVDTIQGVTSVNELKNRFNNLN